jgi:hypothetical protein
LKSIHPFFQLLKATSILLFSFHALAAPRDEPRRPDEPKRPEEPKSFPSLKMVLADGMSALEKDLAVKMMHRSDGSGSTGAMLETQIDLRVIHRWLLGQAAVAQPQSDLQIAALLRAMELTRAIAGLDESLRARAAATPSQKEAAGQIRKISFALADLKDVAELDDLSHRVGYAMQNLASPTMVDPRTIPLMRPAPFRIAAGATTEPATREGPRTLADLSAEITRAAISLPLRQQLLAVAKAATTAAADPNQQADAAALQQMLANGVDLAKGLSATTALSTEARTDIETQLAEGLALFTDPRTRSAGKERVAQLNEYRAVMNRLARNKLSSELRKTLAPAFIYVQTHAAQGQKMLNAIEAYASICEGFDAIPRRDNPVINLRHVTDDAARQFEAGKAAFIAMANDPNVSPEVLEIQLADLSAASELYAILDGMQHTYDTLNGYKPRPFGAIETRTLKAAVAATATIKSPTRSEAIRYLSDLSKLAQLSGEATARSLSDIPPPVVKAYAGISLGEFEAKCRLMMAELVSQVASGADLDKKKVARLRSVGELCDSLRYAALAERAVAGLAPLSRWVDWTLTVEQAQAMLLPYQKQLSAAFGGFISDAPDAVEIFLKQRGDLLPLVALLNQDIAYADACAALPTGLAGDLAQLMTPMDGQPFATERYVSFAVTVGALADADSDEAATALDFAIKRLARDLRRAVRDLQSAGAAPIPKPAKGK